MALDWTNKINNVDNVDANDVNTLAAAIKDVEQSVTTEDGKLTDHKTKAVLDHPDSSVTTNKIANGAVSTDKIAPNAVTGSRIANNAVTDTKIADGAVTTSKIGKNAVGTDNIKDAAVDSAKIANGSIAARHIIDGQVTRDKIAPDSISSDKLANKSVTTEKIADVAVTTEKIKDGAVTSDKLAKKISVEEVNVSGRVMAYHDCGDETSGEEMYEYVKLFHNGSSTNGNYGIQFGNPSDLEQGSITHTNGYYIPEDSGQSPFITLNGSAPGEAANGVVIDAHSFKVSSQGAELVEPCTTTIDTSDVTVNTGTAVHKLTEKANTADIAQNYANALKGKVSGNNAVRINDSSPVEHEMNVRVSSKNVIPYPYVDTTKTVKGITFTDNGDGTITVNGTATGDTVMTLVTSPTSLSEGSYVLSGTPNGGVTTYYIQAYIDGKYGRADVAGQTAIYSVNKGQKVTMIEFYVKTGATFDNLVVKPQFERGTTATDYTPYIAPSSVTLSETGKNLIPYPYAQTTKTVNGITFTDNGDGSITIDGTATANATFTFSDNLPINLSGIYTLSKNVPDVYLHVAYYKNNSYLGEKGASAGATSVLVDLTTIDCDRARSSVQIKSGTTINKAILKPQLELGSTKTDYEKYVPRKTFTPSADGTVTGVNNIYPTTSLLSNKDNVIIDVEYNRDINKAFEELQNAILAQGSNT